ncbi:glycosyltransferase family 4 protein [Methylobacterium sp. WL6]|uniref:glycosyltransferase family 4 protein n=1 Tax=Methylobacterium sp. WL6 TaxID=2603901 RepID=UPI0011CB8AEA|nr:glycosyltransferase family 4 protein [Methylobacterium sp. WL6]TXN69685.1 glycosyltransferase family 4 protein [Methylobacterium sp. WL6]
MSLDINTQIYFNSNQKRTDVHVSTVFDMHEEHFKSLEGYLNEFNPDVVWLEQPWLWPVVKRYLTENSRHKTTIIYGSQNVEFRLIDSSAPDLEEIVSKKLAEEVMDLESDLCRSSHGIVAVSEADAEYYRTFGKPVLVATNGVSPKPAPGGFDYWSNALRHSSSALFVGSAHPPNAEGFITMLGTDLSFMAPNEKILVVGGVCSLLSTNLVVRRNRGLIMPRLHLLGSQDAGGLATFFVLSKAIILPIVSGGGTNLKTAEALYSRKPIIATSKAFRGYERFASFPNVHISDDPDKFRDLIRDCLASDASTHSISEAQSIDLDELLWSRTLALVGKWTRQISSEISINGVGIAAKANFEEGFQNKKRKLLISQGLLLKNMLYSGWHDFEEEGTWSKDRIAIIKISNPFVSDHLKIRIFIDLLSNRREQTAVDIYTASAHHISKICHKTETNMTFAFETSASDFNSDGQIELYIQIQKLGKPRPRGIKSDERFLGVRLKKIAIENYDDDAIESNHANFIRKVFKCRLRGLFWRKTNQNGVRPR